MNTGKFIVVEGLEGAGKTTAIQSILSVLEQFGIQEVVTTREPGGTPLAEQMRTLIKNAHPQDPLSNMAELLLLYAARIQVVDNVIKPALERGAYVVGDRHDMSSQAYQGGGRGFDQQLMAKLKHLVLKDFQPNLTFYMDIDPKLGLERAKARGELDRIEQMQLDFFVRTRTRYLELAKDNKQVIVIDAAKPLKVVTQNICTQLANWLDDNAN